ncbi:succinyl-CoA:coenzyme A transferase [Clostridium acetireducens DSM 10703]|jgi:acyl-CoA hydrolase|uniref:Succinyl-CoA:coenzyme A transferase n=1 Tax=Clostridium acetireducens DSM 10703 TaxID=1121290 RepID=A0A1E8EZ83_9CLOT|nr:acetyl-CoA hydrolase/transferase C-terminal domain-containing protein [Clostridium acetireducens]OFI06291.1 succinyl-CoA:coenzyme A transferase [Clostridium acetireducens DSM 10703]
MDYREEYKKKLITVEEAVEKVKSNYEIIVGTAGAEAIGFLDHLHLVKDKVENVSVVTCLSQVPHKCFTDPSMKGHFHAKSIFFGPADRQAYKLGLCSYIPNHLHFAGRKRLDFKTPDIFVASVTPMDKHGNFSLSLSALYEMECIQQAKMLIVEVNENLPRCYGDVVLNIRDIDFIFEDKDVEIPGLGISEPSELDLTIGKYIAELVDDTSTIQLGIGGIPNAVAKALSTKKDLGIHTEMFNDAMVDLYEAGVVTNKYKTLYPNKMITAFALGSKKVYDFMDGNPLVEIQRGSFVNDPYVVGQNYKMVSVNTAIEVDLTGQVCSESIGPRHYSGSGGQCDTAVGAQNCKEGKSIIALHSTAKKGTVSTICTFLKQGAITTLQRNDVDYVVTEYGVASLRGRSISERVGELINIAHPDFRAELKKDVEKYHIW